MNRLLSPISYINNQNAIVNYFFRLFYEYIKSIFVGVY